MPIFRIKYVSQKHWKLFQHVCVFVVYLDFTWLRFCTPVHFQMQRQTAIRQFKISRVNEPPILYTFVKFILDVKMCHLILKAFERNWKFWNKMGIAVGLIILIKSRLNSALLKVSALLLMQRLVNSRLLWLPQWQTKPRVNMECIVRKIWRR